MPSWVPDTPSLRDVVDMDWLAWLPADWWARILLALVPTLLLGIFKALFKTKKKHEALQAKISTITAIDDFRSLPNLQVHYGNMKVKNLKVTNALIWNSGRNPIRRENIAQNAPIRLQFPDDSDLLDVRVHYQTHSANDAQVGIEDARVRIEFDFLNPNDAILIQCLHTGSLGEAELFGTLIGQSVSVDSTWDHQLGIHGASSNGLVQVVNPRLMGAIGAVFNIILVSIILLSFLFDSWLPLLVLSALLFLVAVWNLWPSGEIPRQVKRDLQRFMKKAEATGTDSEA